MANSPTPPPSSLLPSPPQSPTKELEDDNQHPPISHPPSFTSISPPLEDVNHHQQPLNSNSLPLSSPQNSLAPPENVDDHQQPPPVQVDDHQQPLASPLSSLSSPPQSSHPLPPTSPSPTGPGEPVDKSYHEHESELRGSPPSLEEPEDQLGNPNYSSNHEFPIRQQPSSPSTSGPDDPVGNPSYGHNTISDHESPSSPPPHSSLPSQLAAKLQEDLHESLKSKPSPSGSPPPPTARSPSSPQETLEPNTYQIQATQPAGSPLLKTTPSFSPKKPQPSPWSHQETANLIQAYQEKWYSLNKGQLKASQWEEVAITVAAHCGCDEPMKSAKQCRHKIEKLRKRYRVERAKPRARANAWNFFKLLDDMERGPLLISSSQSMALIDYLEPSNSCGKKRLVGDSDNEFHVTRKSSRTKSYNYLGGVTRNLQWYVDGSYRVTRGLRTPVVQKRKVSYQEDNGEEEKENYRDDHEEEEEEEIDGVAVQLAAEIKGFAERFVNMENKKIEMMRDTERYRLEMETKRMEMILESQQKLLETVNRAFSSSHKKRNPPAN